jgi:lysosomal alpha-glucosidase
MHYIPLIDAGISSSEKNGTYIPYDEGIRKGIFIYDVNNTLPFKGKVWNLKSTVWPDFTNPESKSYYQEMMNNMYKSFEYDGVWIVCI